MAPEAGDEKATSVLKHYDGYGAVRLLQDQGIATLLERAVPGIPLSELVRHVLQYINIYCIRSNCLLINMVILMLKNKFLLNTISLLLLSTSSLFGMEDNDESHSVQRASSRSTQHLTSLGEDDSHLSSLFKDYVNLFLTPFDAMILKGDVEWAQTYALRFIRRDFISSKGQYDGMHNLALDGQIASRYKTFGGLLAGQERTARFNPFYFRTLSTDEDFAIQQCKSNISDLERAQLSHSKIIEDLHKEKDAGQSVYEDIQTGASYIAGHFLEKVRDINPLINIISPLYPDLLNTLKSYVDYLEKYQQKVKDRERINLEEAHDSIEEILATLNNLHKNSAQNLNYEAACYLVEEYIRDCFYELKIHNDSLTVSKDEPLRFFERRMLENFGCFKEDTDAQIAHERKKIAFIKAHPWFFVIPKRDRFELVGAQNLQSDTQYGARVNVGIIDGLLFTPSAISKFPLAHKTDSKHILSSEAIQPGTIKGRFEKQRIDSQHGIHVAGIVASDQISHEDSRPLGVAPQAQLVFFDQSLTRNSESGLTETDQSTEEELIKDDASTGVHLNILNRLRNEKQGSFTLNIGEKIRTYTWDHEKAKESNVFLKTPVKLFNISLADPAFDENGKIRNRGLDFFEMMWTITLRPDALFFLGLGNDHIDVSTSKTVGRTARALTQDPATQERAVFVTNLMEDGMSLCESSNIPGNNPDLRKRTLSAIGTNVESTMIPSSFQKDRGRMTGTSMATPQVTGAAAVLLSNYPDFSNNKLTECLLKGATPLLYDEKSPCVYELKTFTADALTSALEENAGGIDIAKYQFISSSPLDIPDHIKVTKEWWEKSQELYGQGRVNIQGALDFAENFRKL